MSKVKNEKGQSLVEFALVLPLLLLLLLGIMEFGLMFSNKLTLVNAAREGARYGAVHNVDSDYIVKVKSKVKSAAVGLNISDTQIDVVKASGNITVNVSYNFTVLDPITSAITGNSITLSSQAVMAME
jgi:Flp pilus assembly protein TadG